jgi:predicted metalloprotease
VRAALLFYPVAGQAEGMIDMRLDDLAQSTNVEDRRGGGGMARAGGLGIGGMIVAGIFAYVLGIDPRLVMGGADMLSRGIGSSQQTQGRSGPVNDQLGTFASRVLTSNEQVWGQVFPAQAGELVRGMEGQRYQQPRLVLFTGGTRSGCGDADSAMGPFYCPSDRRVYLDTTFFREMAQKFRAGGDFAYAYVIAHEVGHHIQNQLGILGQVQQRQRQVSRREANALSVRNELMADCLAGVWAHHSASRLEPGDIEEAMRAAAAIGDDALQRQSQGQVVPDSFTHGTSQQRMRWFTQGYRSGRMGSCNTFAVRDL